MRDADSTEEPGAQQSRRVKYSERIENTGILVLYTV
mgnify:FL=1